MQCATYKLLVDRCTGRAASGVSICFSAILFLSSCGGGGSTSQVIEGPPSAPTGVKVVITGLDTMNISWNSVATANSYTVYWATVPGVSKSSSTKSSAITATDFTHTGLSAGTTYYYVVTATNNYGESSESVVVFELLNIPRPPGSIAVVAGDTQATFSWNDNGATSYNIYMATSPGVTKANGTAHTAVTSPYIITGLTNGTTYYFVMTSVNSHGESGESSEVPVTPSAINGLAVSGTVKYEDKEYGAGGFTGATKYNAVRYATVEAVDAADGTSILASGTTDATGSYNLPILPADSGKTVYVRAISTAALPAVPTPAPPVSVKYPSNALYAVAGSNFVPTGSVMANIHIPVTSPAAGAFNILDVYTSGAQFVHGLSGTYPVALTAFWQAGNPYGTYYCTSYDSVFCPRGEGIYILNFNGDSDEYDDDVLWHEYGHFIAAKYSKDSSPGGGHYIFSNDLDLRLSWSEGWGGYFPFAIKSWLSATPDLLSTAPLTSASLYVDTKDSSATTFDFGNPPGVPSYYYSSSEAAVAKVLIDLTNNYGIQPLWDTFASLKPLAVQVNFEVFWDSWIARGNISNIGILNSRSISYSDDTYESGDDVPDIARKVTVNGPSEAHTIFGSGDVDYIAFDATAGQPLTVKTTALRNGADTYISIIKPDMTTVLYTNDNASNATYAGTVPYNFDPIDGIYKENGSDILGSAKSFTAPSTGTYFIEVKSSPSRPLSAGKYGNYSLKITSP